MKTLDLHLIRHKQAMEKVRNTLMEAQSKGSFSLTIITGNSSVLQRRIFDEILRNSPYTYYIPSWNLGQIIVEYMEL
ncbi:MAG: Smr/MutS family protein [Flavobacteriaceae bacterium]|nr:Smr/MutS family protein [Flavobacteriaceae bacterium]